MPVVSVLMAMHNGLPYLQEAVCSILIQSFRDFEFIIVDDASTDGSRAFVESEPDNRVKLLVNPRQMGLSESLNKGIEASTGKYIARMDHDDISLSARLAQQVSFLDANPDVDLVGTWATTMGSTTQQTWRYPLADNEIRSEFLFNSSLVHSSVMWRQSSFQKFGLTYDTGMKRAQDYELWTRAKNHIRFANLPKALVRYRIHPASVGTLFSEEQKIAAEKVREREIAQLGIEATTAELVLHHAISRWEFPRTIESLHSLEAWLLKLVELNRSSKTYPASAFGRTLERRWWAACRANVRLGASAWRVYISSSIRKLGNPGLAQKTEFWAKSSWHTLRQKR